MPVRATSIALGNGDGSDGAGDGPLVVLELGFIGEEHGSHVAAPQTGEPGGMCL